MASCSCTNCRFINYPSQKSTQTRPQSSYFSANPKWACKACTFLNSCSNSNCQICGTRAYGSVISTFNTDGDDGNDRVDSCGFVRVKAHNKAVADMEVTPSSYYIFQQSSRWNVYKCSVSNEEALTKSYFCMQSYILK